MHNWSIIAYTLRGITTLVYVFMTIANPMPPANMAGTVTNEVVANRAIPDRPCPLEEDHKR